MKWRTILGVTVGLMLPLAFMFDHCGALLRAHHTQSMARWDARVVPILPADQRRALPTYRRSCESQKDCTPPLACVSSASGEQSVCIDSSCMTDLQCRQGFACRTRRSLGDDGPLVRRCVLIGVRKEGQPCFDHANHQEEACERGLLCGDGHCGRPCQLEVPSSCPSGFVCRAGPDAPSCQPFCEGGDCPEGQQCVREDTGEARCMIVHGDNCQRAPCEAGQQCQLTGYTPGPEAWAVKMECVTPCDGTRSCPEGSVCFLGGCKRECRPDARDVCGPGRQCTEYVPGRLWLCEPTVQ